MAQQQTILVFGDSLSAAYGIPRASGWVNLLQQELQRSHPQYKVVNASISGETASGGRQRIAPALRQHSPDIVILELGANDGLRGTPIADIENNKYSLLGALRASSQMISYEIAMGLSIIALVMMTGTLSVREIYSTHLE